MLKRIISVSLVISIILLFASCATLRTQTVDFTLNESYNLNSTTEYEVLSVNPVINIDTSNVKNGIVKVQYLSGIVEGVRIYLLYNYESCAGYDVQDTSKDTIISLTNGAGIYYIEVAINDGNTETIVEAKSFEVTTIDEFAPYLHSTYAVYYTEEMSVIKDAKKYTQNVVNVAEKIELIKEFVVESLDYVKDKDKDYAKWTYFPNSDEIYKKGKGVCTDFATMFTAICRSQNIPCKLITGYAGSTEELHVWVEVFDEVKWKIIDLTLEDAIAAYSNCIIVAPSYYEAITVD